jgi:glycosyltransferase involved in cell wall biosynthesis
MNGQVSVVIPCFNRVDWIEETIVSAYGQSHPPVEVIVVDDGSTDGSWERLQELRQTRFPGLRILSHEGRINCGENVSRATGVAAARGEFVAFLDSDDLFEPQKLEQQLRAFHDHPALVLCHTAIRVIGDLSKADFFEASLSGSPEQPYFFRQQPEYLKRCRICISSTLVRTSALRRIPFAFIPAAMGFPDFLCWCLLAAEGPFLFLPQPLTLYRVHPSSHTSSLSVYGEDLSAPAYFARSLKYRYATLEFLLVLLVRSRSWPHGLRVLAALLENLRLLLIAYLWDPAPDPCDRNGRHCVPVNGVVRAILVPFSLVRALRSGLGRLLQRPASPA